LIFGKVITILLPPEVRFLRLKCTQFYFGLGRGWEEREREGGGKFGEGGEEEGGEGKGGEEI